MKLRLNDSEIYMNNNDIEMILIMTMRMIMK